MFYPRQIHHDEISIRCVDCSGSIHMPSWPPPIALRRIPKGVLPQTAFGRARAAALLAEAIVLVGGDGVPPTEPALNMVAELSRLVAACRRQYADTGSVDLRPVFAQLAALPKLPGLPAAAEFAQALADAETDAQLAVLARLIPPPRADEG